MTNKFNDRKAQLLIVHGTEVDHDESVRILSGAAGLEASCHYYIDDQGIITSYVDETKRAWHAGRGYWAGISDINSVSIGIELLALSKNRKFDGDDTRYTEKQINAFTRLASEIIERHKIKPYHILGHQDIAATVERTLEPMFFETVDQLYASGRNVGLERKYDPGPSFPWQELAAKGVGVWHGLEPVQDDPILEDKAAAAALWKNLTMYGYDTRGGADVTYVIKAFQTHFMPWHICGKVTQQSLDIAKRLVEIKYDCLG
jgi:N-acetylmuramoyl-L-alanine amidase